jgi:pyruvate/2-oxoglutarate dehydrogenase complex dihydrolipoamide dehydrogenase (E3) component
MDNEIAKQTQKILKKQGMNFKLGTKVISGDTTGDKVKLKVDSAKGGKEETVGLQSFGVILNKIHHGKVMVADR